MGDLVVGNVKLGSVRVTKVIGINTTSAGMGETSIGEYRLKTDHSYHVAVQRWFRPGDEKFSFIKNPLNIENIVAGDYIVVHYDTLGQPNDLKAMPSEEFLDKFEAVPEEDAEKPHLRKRVTMRKDLMCPFCPAECR